MWTSSASSVPSCASSSGSRSTPVHADRPDPGQVVEADLLELDRSGATPNRRRTGAGNRSRRCTARSLRCPPSTSAWVTIPTGFVKSTIQASGAPRRRTASASSRTTGTVRSAFANPPAPTVSWPTSRTAAAASRRRAGPPARRPGAGRGRSPRRRSRRRDRSSGRRARPALRASIRSASPPTIASRSGSMSRRTISSIGTRSPPGEAVDQLRGVGAAAADDRQLQAHRTSPVCRQPRVGAAA